MEYQSNSITISKLNKYFYTQNSPVTALQDINLKIGDGEFFCIVGPSGCGKSTLLRILAGLEEATSGHIDIKSTIKDRPANSMVFQEQSVLPWMTVSENQNILNTTMEAFEASLTLNKPKNEFKKY